MATTKKKTAAKKPASQYVGKGEFKQFQDETNESLNTIIDLKEGDGVFVLPHQSRIAVVPQSTPASTKNSTRT